MALHFWSLAIPVVDITDALRRSLENSKARTKPKAVAAPGRPPASTDGDLVPAMTSFERPSVLKLKILDKIDAAYHSTELLLYMNQPGSKWMRLFAAVVVTISVTQPVRAELLEKTSKVAGATVRYKVVLPAGYDPAKAYPAILTFGGGPQTMNTVDSVLSRNFRAEAEKRGYIVVAPAAPDDRLFFEDGARIFPEFLKMILADYKIQDNKFHIAGPSNGGIAAFHVAAANPQYFLSVTAFPGYMWQPSLAKLQAISKMCVFMYVGENDEYMWHSEMKREAELLRSGGTVARYTVEKGQPHRLETLAGANAGRLFDGFEETKKGCSK
jgi:predicted esterase